MISLEQIRLLEGKISRAIDLIRVLKEENSTLRRGLDGAQKRMKELETLVDGFKADQKEIETVIVRTLRHLDDLEDGGEPRAEPAAHPAAAPAADRPRGPSPDAAARRAPAQQDGPDRRAAAEPADKRGGTAKEELDIF